MSLPNNKGTVVDSSESEEIRSRNDSSNTSLNFGDVGEDIQSCCAPHGDAVHLNTFLQRESKRVARNPCTYMCSSVFITLILSCVGIIVGNFADNIEVESGGWWSRGTLLSKQARQATIVNNQRFNLAYNRSAWDIWLNPDIDHPNYETLIYSAPIIPDAMLKDMPKAEDNNNRALSTMHKLIERAVEEDEQRRQLDQEAPNNVLAGCDLGFYSNPSPQNLWPIWKIPDKEFKTTDTRSVLDADVLEAICLAEANTQAYLEENGLCDTDSRGCDSEKCIPPYSIVLYARLLTDGALESTSDGGFAMDCKGLSKAWTPDLQKIARDSLIQDIKDLKSMLTGDGEKEEDPQYPDGYYPALVQSDFDENDGRSQYTSSVFDIASDVTGTDLYEEVDNFDRAEASKIVKGAYDTGYERMNEIMVESLLSSDMTLALGSAGVIAVAIMLHTQSPLITGLGLLQIILSFPLAYFIYNLVLGFKFFPFLNFIGVFVVFALGAGDIFVAFDKWTMYRKNNMTKSTEYVAAYALPEAISAMFLTTLTTAVAFFATAVCPVAPIKMFAIFCGLLIIFDYILTVCFVLPCLCIYDQALIKGAAGTQTGWCSGCWMGCVGCFACCSHTAVYNDIVVSAHDSDRRKGSTAELTVATKEKELTEVTKSYDLTQRGLLTLSDYLYRARWPLLAVCIVSFGCSCYYALKLTVPESSDVRLLKPSIQYEQAYAWRKELLLSDLNGVSGSRSSILWGVDPSDNGDANDPYDGTSLVLDETFDPSSPQTQIYLRDFCDNLFEEDFAWFPEDSFVCPMNEFDQWLKDQNSSNERDDLYNTICGSPNGIPVASDKFHACMSGWAKRTRNFDVLSRDGIVKIMRVPFRNRGIFTDPYGVLEKEWVAIEEHLTTSNEGAPEGVQQAFFVGLTFHWYDTNGSIQKTAYSSAGIALAACAGIILLSSQSVILTVFSTITILFILMSVTAMLVAFGWTLGFLESICFSILIGVSVDFVIHFTHAYVHQTGDVPRKERTKYAMVTMGPSILATAGTTFFSAVVMLFCTITFFRKFAMVLFLTVIMATFASFVVFITLTNCFGPTNPSVGIFSACCGERTPEQKRKAQFRLYNNIRPY